VALEQDPKALDANKYGDVFNRDEHHSPFGNLVQEHNAHIPFSREFWMNDGLPIENLHNIYCQTFSGATQKCDSVECVNIQTSSYVFHRRHKEQIPHGNVHDDAMKRKTFTSCQGTNKETILDRSRGNSKIPKSPYQPLSPNQKCSLTSSYYHDQCAESASKLDRQVPCNFYQAGANLRNALFTPVITRNPRRSYSSPGYAGHIGSLMELLNDALVPEPVSVLQLKNNTKAAGANVEFW
jgi:hypothetical protein